MNIKFIEAMLALQWLQRLALDSVRRAQLFLVDVEEQKPNRCNLDVLAKIAKSCKTKGLDYFPV